AADCATFHCRDCWAVLADSLQLCAQQHRPLGLLACFKVTNDVCCEDSLMFGLEGALLGCAYYSLSCRCCGLTVGFVPYSSSRELASLRGCFCFFKDSIFWQVYCTLKANELMGIPDYVLKTQKIIEASKVNFPAVSLKE
ncbi:MS18B protein, partial [Urocolius indicus]|nr:MS18B protein [Urocolius indicus]